MPSYLYRCPVHGQFTGDYPMRAVPPTVLCGICKRECRRVYVPVPTQFHSDGFTKSLPDRPDERLNREIAHSMDFDAVTGKTWEEADRQTEQARARHGELLRKDVVLP